MNSLSRMAGAIVACSNGLYFLVGDLKEPCDFGAFGFKHPGAITPLEKPYLPLETIGEVTLKGPWLELSQTGEDLAHLALKRFVIERNGSVSERLWRIATHEATSDRIDCTWLSEMPDAVWQIVRDSILKCS